MIATSLVASKQPWPPRICSFSIAPVYGRLPRFKFERCRVHAIAQAGGFWAVAKYVAEVCAAAGALHFSTNHSVGGVGMFAHGRSLQRLPKAGPAGAGIKLCIRTEKFLAAACAAIGAGGFGVPVFAGEGLLGAGLPGDAVLIGREDGLPLVVAFALPMCGPAGCGLIDAATRVCRVAGSCIVLWVRHCRLLWWWVTK